VDPITGEGNADTRKRPYDGHQEFGFGACGFFSHLGNATENEEGNPFHRNAKSPGNKGMKNLVKDDREKKTHGSDYSHQPIGLGGKVLVVNWEETYCEGPNDKNRDDDPTQIDPDFEAEERK
jgi:hypothetical protein